jgi:hypothetical protein
VKTKAELSAIAAGIAEQLDAMEPADAAKVLELVAVLRKPASTTTTITPHFAPPSQRPLMPGYPQLDTIHCYAAADPTCCAPQIAGGAVFTTIGGPLAVAANAACAANPSFEWFNVESGPR